MAEDASQPTRKKSEPLHAWFKLIGIAFMVVVNDGEYRSLGLIYLELLDLYNQGPVKTSLVATMYSAVMMIASPLFGYLGDRFSSRWIVIIAGALGGASLVAFCFSPNLSIIIAGYGLFVGSCGAAIYTNCLAELNASFDKNRGLANGIMFTGSALGELVIPLLIQLLITNYSIRGTFLILGALRLNMCAFGMLLSRRKCRKPALQKSTREHGDTRAREVPNNSNTITNISFIKLNEHSSPPSHSSEGQTTQACDSTGAFDTQTDERTRKSAAGANRMSLCRSLLSVQFCCYLVYWTLSMFGWSGITVYIPAHMDDNGFTDSQVSLALSLIGGAAIVTNVFLGFSVDFERVNKRLLVAAGFIVLAVSTFVLPWMLTFPLMCTYCVIAGIASSTLHLNIGPLVVDALGIENVGLGVGAFSLIFGVSATVSPVIFGSIKESTGGYTLGFVLVAISYVISAVAGLISWVHWARTKKNQVSQSVFHHPKRERTNSSSTTSTQM